MEKATAALWPHQRDALPRLLQGHQLLAWEPGTGKTVGALTALRQLQGRALIVVPAAVRYQWLDAATELAFKTQLVESRRTAIDPKAEVAIVSYHMVTAPDVWKSAMSQEWAALILDEAHYCKTPSTKWTKAIFGARKNSPAALYRRARHVWALTGTPIMTDPSDLWVLVSRLFPDAAENTHAEWIARWCTGYNTPYGFRVTGARNPAHLARLLTPFMTRVRKADVFKDRREPLHDRFRLPPRKVTANSPVMDQLLAMMEDDAARAFAGMSGGDPEIARLRRELGLSKAAEVADYVVNELAPGEKCLLFYQHTDVGLELAKRLLQAGLEPVLYRGGMSTTLREHDKRRFIHDPDCRVFIGQIQASGTGLDGLQVARRVIIAEEPWTPGALDQLISRADRAGQKHQVHVTSVVIAKSYDDKVSRALERRKKIIKQVIDGEAA